MEAQRKEVIAAVKLLGGKVKKDTNGHITVVSLSNTRATDFNLLQLEKLKSLTLLDLRNTKITDAGLASVMGLTTLRFLDLDNTGITDAGMGFLGGIEKPQGA